MAATMAITVVGITSDSAVGCAGWLPNQIEHFRFSSNRENALSSCFYAVPDAKPLGTFAGTTLDVGCLVLRSLVGEVSASSRNVAVKALQQSCCRGLRLKFGGADEFAAAR